MKVFICSPLRGNTEEIVELNKSYCRSKCEEAVKLGFTPLAPHLYFTQFLDDNIENERDLGINMGLEWLRECDEIWVCGPRISEGMQKEINYALKLGIDIVYKD